MPSIIPPMLKEIVRALFLRWTWQVAWRDSRSTRARLLFFSLNISIGIGALIAVQTLSRNVERAVRTQARTLVGADLVLTSRRPFTNSDEQVFARLGGEQASETSFSTMLLMTNGTRLVNARAIEGAFPFYGRLETDPPEAADKFARGEGILVEQTVLQQFDAHPGEDVRLGDAHFQILGALRKVPGDSVAFGTLIPRLYLPASKLPQTGLLRGISLSRYRRYFKFPPDFDVESLVKREFPERKDRTFEIETVARRQRDFGNALTNLFSFLNLVAVAALLLGSVGVSTAVQVHIRQKLQNVAVLRCLGASIASTFSIYLVQAFVIGFVGSAVGVALGIATAYCLPAVLKGLIPIAFENRLEPFAILPGAAAGFGVCTLFTLLPLLEVRHVSPLAAIRASYEPFRGRDKAVYVIYTVMVLGIATFAMVNAHPWYQGLFFAAGVTLAVLILMGTSRGLIWLARRYVPAFLPFTIRQGLAGLHRPNNRTTLLIVSLGLGAFLILTLQFTREVLLHQLFPPQASSKANAILFDIQPDQVEGVASLVRSNGLEVLDIAPIVTMRLQSIRSIPVETLASRPGGRGPDWALRREYRSTWRNHLVDSEKVVAGRFVPEFTGEPSTNHPVPISFESGIAKDLKIQLGDAVVFDVQGIPIPCEVTSLRDVEWRQIRPNFFVVFPTGVLESAPSMHLMATHVPTPAASAHLQRELVGTFSNVSAIDLTLVLETLETILDKVALAVRFMTGITVVTGLFVLAGTIVSGRAQRLQEAVLLRTLGATRFQIREILFAEYLILGIFAALVGILLATLSSWSLAHFAFKAEYVTSLPIIVIALITLPGLTVFIGLLTSRGIAEQPPLEILRDEN